MRPGAVQRSLRRAVRSLSGGGGVPSRLVRFEAADGRVLHGEPLGDGWTTAAVVRSLYDPCLTGETIDIHRLLAPLEPPVVFATGLNYADHVAETRLSAQRFPVLTVKTPNAVTGPNSPIRIPRCAADPPEVDFEGELAVVIGRPCKDVSVERALEYVLGYTVANDVTARRWQGKRGGGQWVRGKSFDTFLPLGPCLLLSHAAGDPQGFTLSTALNGTEMQRASTAQMQFSVADIVSFVSQGTTLPAGTVILTGTPSGVGYVRTPPMYLRPGDVVAVTVDRIGTLTNPVQADSNPDSP